MEQDKITGQTSLLLSFVAGFCDTVTFVAAGELFSAHVTGNFIVFAYDIIRQSDTHAWQKLITFPLFIVSVMIGGRIARRWTNIYTLLILQATLLVIAGLMALGIKNAADQTQWYIQIIAMIVVVAMAFQNTFGKLNPKASFGLTTVMTGNVTQASLDFVKAMGGKPFDTDAWTSLKKQLVLILGFLFGCIGGALCGKTIGMLSVAIPGVIMALWLLKNRMAAGNPIK